ncbi:ABC transporter ATP-binding protein [Hoyosella altamirensis]|uniref:ABC-2 type transport system ATP-binding protein n=1 Tax=Hoyosella altamirensis TaxID=616997 RepID=A0A839RNY7_9ACTN|nr:ABC transporter ATP-binding protein [Hoyosella altamirensis]MBB3038019.1 ABC-2 type transport system ATP-binding protein [Hoyosella altamirensis]
MERLASPHHTVGAVNASHDAVIDARGICYSYGAHRAVNSVDLQVQRGEIFALLGTNGAGKTTTLEILQGFRAKEDGELKVFGTDPRQHPGTVRARTGVVLQEAGFFGEISVTATVKLWKSLSSRTDDVDRVLHTVGLDHRASHTVTSLSGGERRRLDLALAIWGNPELIILDEPTTGLDPESRRTLWSVISDLRGAGTTVVLTTHYLEEAEALADRVAIMHGGEIAVTGTLSEVLASRPSRVTVELDDIYWPPAHHRPPDGVEMRRETQRGKDVLVLESTDQQLALTWLMNAADTSGVRLGPLRATPASLEEVFLDISGQPLN